MTMDEQKYPPRAVSDVLRFLDRLQGKNRRVTVGMLTQALGTITTPTGDIQPELLESVLEAYQLRAEEGQPDGYASLDANGLVPLSQLPAIANPQQPTYLVSGGQVTWVSGLTFDVAGGQGYINGTFISWAAQQVTLDAADPSDPRIDVIYIGDDAVADSITGTPSADPSEPVVDPVTQLRLALVTVGAGATEPDVDTELLYDENLGSSIEWDWTTSGSGWALNSTDSPRSGTLSIEGTDVAENAYLQGQRGSSAVDPADFTQLVFYLLFKAVWGADRRLQVTLRMDGVQVGNALNVSSGFFGVDEANTATYQACIIPMLSFAAPPAATFNQVRIQAIGSSGTAIGCYIDDIFLTTGGVVIIGDGGLTQDEADARYLQRANNLSDLGDAATARANLGLSQLTIQEIDGTPAETEPIALEFPNGTLSEPFAGVIRYTPAVGTDTDEKAKVSANDTTAGYLNGKLVAGDGITLTENNDGGDETLTIEADVSASGQYRQFVFEVSGGDFTFLKDSSGQPIYALVSLE